LTEHSVCGGFLNSRIPLANDHPNVYDDATLENASRIREGWRRIHSE
jgi:hypothetical protein